MIGSFNAAQTGLKTSQTALDNISNNIANENSEGYVKRVANLEELDNANGSYNNGVGISSIDRQTNEYMLLKIQDESTTQSYYSKNSSVFGSLETIFLETDTSGLSKSMNDYSQSLENLRSNPNSEVYKNEFEASTNSFIYDLQGVYTDIEDLQKSLKDEMYTQVAEVNKLTNEISNINNELSKNPNSLDLLDKRDLLITQLSSYGDIEVTNDENYFQIKFAGESIVFNNTSNELSVSEQYTKQENIYDTASLNDSNITNGENISLTLNNGESINIIADTTGTSEFDVKQQIIDEINSNLNSSLNAGLDDKGNLIIESKEAGEESFFDLEIKLEDSNELILKNNNLSKEASDDASVQIYDKDLEFNSGSLKSLDENTTTNNPNNILSATQKELNNLAYSIIDTNKSYVIEDDTYIFGNDNTNSYSGTSTINNPNLFSGSSVMTMNLNEKNIDSLTQEDLDYLSSLQFKDDLNIDGSSSSEYSFSEYLIGIKVNVSASKENNDFKLETQESIVMSLQGAYDQISKVDSDEELIHLMEFQAAYQANAKVITAIDEMLQTVLNM